MLDFDSHHLPANYIPSSLNTITVTAKKKNLSQPKNHPKIEGKALNTERKPNTNFSRQ